MKDLRLHSIVLIAFAASHSLFGESVNADSEFRWSTVVNNNDLIPPLGIRNFNSYNQPSVNTRGLVVFRARSRGGPPLGPATHGIYTRDMSDETSELVSILDRTTTVPQPNNLDTRFIETPSFPRIDMESETIATRGNHPPVWNYVLGIDPATGETIETRAGTTGIYANPFGDLITAMAKLGSVPDFSFFEVPEFPGIPFEVFPGAPSVTNRSTVVFKGNYTVDGLTKTGVYFRRLSNHAIPFDGAFLAPAGGTSPAVMIANNTHTLIPGTSTVFGSTSPPTAVGDRLTFSGFDDEENPTLGGIYLARLEAQPELVPLVTIGGPVPGESETEVFTNLSESNAFDGRFVGFWGAWGQESRTVRLYCPEEGNKDRIDYCNQTLVCEDGTVEMDPNSVCDDLSDPKWPVCYQERQVPVHQGIFVHDTHAHASRSVARTGERFDDFVFWNYSGRVPCIGSSGEEGEDDGEAARWRSSAFVAVSGRNLGRLHTAFKARSQNEIGLYLASGPKQTLVTLLDTTMEGQSLDPEAPAGSKITELGIESEGLRRDWLAISAKMGIEGESEDEGMAGIYVTRVRGNPREARRPDDRERRKDRVIENGRTDTRPVRPESATKTVKKMIGYNFSSTIR